jgi:hypothetical protein
VTVEYVVTENESDAIGADKIGAENKGIGQAARMILAGIRNTQAKIGAVAQQALEQRPILRGRDDEDLANAGEHQHRQRIVDHRLVEHRQQLLGDDGRHRIKPGSRAAGQNDAFHEALKTPNDLCSIGYFLPCLNQLYRDVNALAASRPISGSLRINRRQDWRRRRGNLLREKGDTIENDARIPRPRLFALPVLQRHSA